MEAPPNYPGAPKKSKTGLILGGIALAIVLCCCGVCGLGGYFGRGLLKNSFGLVGCSVGMGEHRDALLSYAEDNGGRLPAANTWQDAIKPYLSKVKHDPDAAKMVSIPGPNDDFCDKESKTGITMNVEIAGKKLSEIKDQMGTIALFETPGVGRNKSGAWSEQPFESSPLLIAGERRGWVRQPLKGEVSIKDKRGNIKPIPKGGMTSFDNGPVKISTGTKTDSNE